MGRDKILQRTLQKKPPHRNTMKTLRLILGDQLNYQHSWFSKPDSSVTYLIMEMKQESDYVLHHAQKIVGFFAAMYNFAAFLRKSGHQVIYLRINDPENDQRLETNLQRYLERIAAQKFEYLLPDEYRLNESLKAFCAGLSIATAAYDTEHFYTQRVDLKQLFGGKKNYLMETFYRHMRRQHAVLMDGSQPVGGAWNYDKNNRQPIKGSSSIPPAKELHHNYADIWKEIQAAGISTFGTAREKDFPWPTSRQQSLELLAYFIEQVLPYFGTYQDAMLEAEPFLFHSRLSFALNLKMISPQEVVRRVEEAWRNNPQGIPLSSAEGFIRQIIGWREYVRGIYWAEMPVFKQQNFFGHQRPLPEWFWTGNTRMNCLKQSIGQSLRLAYAHHIQRLMIIGNFSLLAGLHPDAVDRWYLGVYIDAIEWVELPNTRGMSQFADGGKLATKPYVSGAAYIHKMSNYCKTCVYDYRKRHGEKACPFNSLYWRFFDEHEHLLGKNIRLAMMYATWHNMNDHEKELTLNQAEQYLQGLEQL